MKIPVSTTWAARNLRECLARVRLTGDVYVLLKNDKPVAELVPLPGARRTTLRELWDALAVVPVDEDFASDLQSVNAADRPLHNPWNSSPATGGFSIGRMD